MSGEEGLNELIHEVEAIERQLDERVKELSDERVKQRRLPGDLAAVLLIEPPQPGVLAPGLGS
jgi:hypothetical protein